MSHSLLALKRGGSRRAGKYSRNMGDSGPASFCAQRFPASSCAWWQFSAGRCVDREGPPFVVANFRVGQTRGLLVLGYVVCVELRCVASRCVACILIVCSVALLVLRCVVALRCSCCVALIQKRERVSIDVRWLIWVMSFERRFPRIKFWI